MVFEFDDKKSISNKLKHGIDFYQARRLWDDPERINIPARTLNEERFVMIAKSGEEYWSAIYTIRGEIIRIISVRKSRQNEKAIYKS
ncbi:MAG: BrnT family toxin [Bacteroidetes bacterium]|nr:BrnT family toxin [Bacteroidota bacterium]